MKLSILVCSTHNRYNTFLPKILDQLFGQLKQFPIDQKEVEILTLIDNKTIMLGTKRNNLIEISKGDYIVFVDDDDRISEDYISSLLDATMSGDDVITFAVSVSLNGETPKPCYYSKDYDSDFNLPDSYHRLPNHIMCVRRELAEMVLFKPILYGEDSDYSKRLKPLLRSEYKISKTLYFYDYNVNTTEAQEYQREKTKQKQSKALCDVVILSNAKNEEIRVMTQQAIDTLHASEKPGIFNVIVMEQADVIYPNAHTIHSPGEFNFNQFANKGIIKGVAPWVCVANNDLIFTRGWFHQMMLLKYDVMSPFNPGDKRQADIRYPQKGCMVGRHFSGWCFVMNRIIWERIGGLDEDFHFWCADNATVEQLKKINVSPLIVPSSIVKHLKSVTLHMLDKALQNELTIEQVKRFNRKYDQNILNIGK